ncbi:MAG: hypothetical protein FWG66_03515 [Spirochaetes bacterium]|nr:hypothetical protein [Spirochaetota bacterium]
MRDWLMPVGGLAFGIWILVVFWKDKLNFWERRHGGFWFKWQKNKKARAAGRILGICFGIMLIFGAIIMIIDLF